MKNFISILFCLIGFFLANALGHYYHLSNTQPQNKIGELKFESSSFSAQLYGPPDATVFEKNLPNLLFRRLISARKSAIPDDVPTSPDHARVARYLVHQLDWCAMATISTRDPIKNLPFANVFSFSDGLESTGIPYFYLTRLELSVKDIQINANVSMTLSLAQTVHCTANGLDIQDPRCSHIILNGVIKRLENGSEEEAFAKKALWTRHPEMPTWDVETRALGHDWFFAKLEISNVIVLDFFGGPHYISVEEYLSAKL